MGGVDVIDMHDSPGYSIDLREDVIEEFERQASCHIDPPFDLFHNSVMGAIDVIGSLPFHLFHNILSQVN